LALAKFPCHLILPHGLPDSVSGLTPCLLSTYAMVSWRQARSACDPWPIMARSVPPGRLRSSTGSPYEPLRIRFLKLSVGVGLIRIAPGPFQSQVEHPSEQARTPELMNCSVSASRHPGRTYEPLYVILRRRRSAAASLWSVRNPCVIQADSEPPGRRPPAPGSHIRWTDPSPGDLSLAQAW
jgi:hypothetical protein